MATVAEMKARLAQHAAKSLRPQVDTGVSDVEVKHQQATTVETSADLRSAVGTSNTLGQPVASTSGDAANAQATGDSLQVVTNVQPTALVVVERPDPEVNSTVGSGPASETKLDLSNPVHQSFLQRLSDLEAALLAKDPLMKTHLGQIHRTMIEHEEITNLLTIGEISKIMAAQQVHTNTILVKDAVKSSKAKAVNKTASLGLGDI